MEERDNPEHADETGTPDHAQGENNPPGQEEVIEDPVEDQHPYFFMGPLVIGKFNAIVLSGEVQKTHAQIDTFPIQNDHIKDGWHITIKAAPMKMDTLFHKVR
ncbi:hypothetical protein J2S74_003800 [Evansella vedderi]|uniref:Uncharacterized protein n=1 Tax=Evansella vedderi TaxID=38282 RepID=A0ABT9ZYR7_9BACI|nr:hypothetical protein [Evansella vedderi]MDQ0256380.1 hypothetical protein [Evansella vedderi]